MSTSLNRGSLNRVSGAVGSVVVLWYTVFETFSASLALNDWQDNEKSSVANSMTLATEKFHQNAERIRGAFSNHISMYLLR